MQEGFPILYIFCFFAYAAHFLFFRDVCIRTQRAANLATHLPSEGQFYWFLHVTVLNGLVYYIKLLVQKKFAAEQVRWRRLYESNSLTQIFIVLGVAYQIGF
jgi:hypothetical protein